MRVSARERRNCASMLNAKCAEELARPFLPGRLRSIWPGHPPALPFSHIALPFPHLPRAAELLATLHLCYDSLVSTGDTHIAHSHLLDVLRQVGCAWALRGK